MTKVAVSNTVYLSDYTVPPFHISHVVLDIDLVSEVNARVRSILRIERNKQFPKPSPALQLDLEDLILESVAIDGIALAIDGAVHLQHGLL
jgi:aminopeptidase N